MTKEDQIQSQLIWDAPTRLFHWLLVVLLGFSWWSAKTDHMQWHQYSGITVSGLMIFRILWGVIGSSTARFKEFVRSPREVWRYIRFDNTSALEKLGHNPLGGWSVVALLLMVTVQFVSGLFAIDIDGLEEGPLSYLVEFDSGRTASRIHHGAFNFLLGLVVVHVVAVFFYLLIKRRNLIRPMITGRQERARGIDMVSTILAPRWRLLVSILIAGLLAYSISKGLRY